MTIKPDLPPVDVVEVATAVLMLGNRRATMVSTQETVAMAAAIVNFSEALTQAALVLHLIDALAYAETPPDTRRQAEEALEHLSGLLEAVGFKPAMEADGATP